MSDKKENYVHEVCSSFQIQYRGMPSGTQLRAIPTCPLFVQVHCSWTVQTWVTEDWCWGARIHVQEFFEGVMKRGRWKYKSLNYRGLIWQMVFVHPWIWHVSICVGRETDWEWNCSEAWTNQQLVLFGCIFFAQFFLNLSRIVRLKPHGMLASFSHLHPQIIYYLFMECYKRQINRRWC